MGNKRSRTVIAFVVVATLMTVGWSASVALAGSVVLTPLADASINSANASINYGTTSPLHVDGSPIVATYLRFNVANVSAASAVLSISPTSNQSTGFDVHPLSDDTWLENALTWSNHPVWDPTVLASSGAASAGTRLNINLPAASVSNRINVDFVLTTTSPTALGLASRESLSPPQLTITAATPSPTPTATPSPSPTVTPQDPIVLTAGDIACGLINGGGMSPGGACQQAATANLLGAAGVAAILPLGDNQYECGELSNFQSFYGPTWGLFKSLTLPVVGNHEYLTAGGSTPCLSSDTQVGAPGYYTYFGGAASPLDPGCAVACRGYYSVDLGAWHLIALNAECGAPGVGGCGPGSPQEVWLKADLAAHPDRCVLAYWHQPRFTSGQEGDTSGVQTFWSDLYDARADLVLNGHDHDYERFAQLGKIATIDSTGAEQPVIDPAGMREIVVGTGGRNLTRFQGAFKSGSQVHDASTFGVLKLTLHGTSYDWRFLPAGSGTFTDSGSTSCRFTGAPIDTIAPTTPTGLQVVATPGAAALSWTAANDNVGVAGYRILRDNTPLATIPAADPSYRDASSLVVGRTYAYAVAALDAAGNVSAPTAQVLVTIPASSGSLQGTVTNRSSGLPIGGAVVSDSAGSVTTDSAGRYVQSLPASSYTVTATANGYAPASSSVTVSAGATSTQDFALLPGGCITGVVSDSSGGGPLTGATISSPGGATTTDVAGSYALAGLSDGTYDVTAGKPGFKSQTRTVTIAGGTCTTAGFALSPDIFSDGFDSGTFSAWNGGSALNMAVQTATVHTGGGAAEAIVSNVAYTATRTLPSTYSTVYVRTYFRLHSKSTNVGIDRLRTGTGTDILHLYVDNGTGQLGLRNDVTGVSVLSGHAVTVDAWHAIETRVVINGAASTIQVWLDGADQSALDSTTANLGTASVGQVTIGDTNARTLDAFWDDVAVADARIGN